VAVELLCFIELFLADTHDKLHNFRVEASFEGVDFPDEVCPELLVPALYDLQNLTFYNNCIHKG
jgi:hypothetical protein